jgi:serine/threonine-protein kinase
MSAEHPLRPDQSGVVQALEERDLTLAGTLGKYRLLGALGSGGMADVYLAVADGPEGFRKLCVLKLLKEPMAEDEEYRAMFLDEARLAARLNHPNIVQTFEVGETHGRLMIAMEYVEGQPATRVRRRLGPTAFPLTAGISVLCDVLDALEYAHNLADFDGSKLGIVHRDVSPQNIIVGYDGRVKLVDFGIAKSSAAMQETQAGVLKGKVGYMAPEQAMMRDVDGRTDVFSVGVILWEAIAGRRMSEGTSTNDMLGRRIEGRDPKITEVVPDVDPHLAAICDRAMAWDPNARYGSAAELQVELEGWLKLHGVPSRKELSKALRESFAGEREQLRSLVEQRMGDAGSSGMRTSLSLSTYPPPSVGRLPAAGPGPAAGEASITPAHIPPPPSTVSLAPQPTRRSVPGLVVLGVAVTVALGIGGTIYVATSSRADRSTGAPASASESAAQPSAPDPPRAVPAPSESAAAAVAASPPLVPTTSVKNLRPAPAFAGPAGKPPPPSAAHAPSAAAPPAASATVSHPTPPTPTKTPSRPLDEKDPYAP